MEYKYSLGDRIVGIENTPLEETEEEEHIYVVTFDEEINNYSCLYYGSKPNRTTFLYEYQFVKIDD